MSDVTQQQVQAALQNLLQQRAHATFDGSETQSYLHIPYRAADEAILERILPKLIRAQDDVTIDRRTNTLHLRFNTPEGYDSQPQAQPSSAQVEARIRELANDPEKYRRALEAAQRDDGEEAQPAYGQRAAGDFFRLVEQSAKDPRALVSALNAGESTEAKLDACLDQYYKNRPATDTTRQAVEAENNCRIKAREGSQR